MNFTHLHVHSHYSLLDGMSKIPELVDRCRELGMNAIALTDHGNMFGIKEFVDYCAKINGKAAGKVKDCKDEIKKLTKLVDQLPDLESKLSAEADEGQRQALEQKISDANAAQQKIPQLESQLVELQAAADAYVPFKPIVGMEAYCARRDHRLRDKNVKATTGEGREIIVDRSGWHLIILAKNMTGYHNLCKLASIAYLDGFYDRPRIDKQLLAQYHEGLIVSSACLGGEIAQLLLADKVDRARESILWFKSIFGDDYYLEIMRHETNRPMADTTVFAKQQKVNRLILELAQQTHTKVICTNDVHFIREEHAEAHDRLICLATNKKVADSARMHYTKQEWLKSPEEMALIFSDVPEALENTQEIVDKVEIYPLKSKPIMPLFPIPEDFGTVDSYKQRFTEQELFDEFTRNEKGEVVLDQKAADEKIKNLGGYERLYRIKLEADYLAQLTWQGAHYRYGEQLTDEQKERIIFELHVMKTMGFPGYFLIVMDYIRAAREELGVSVGPGRGSAAGSVVAYCLRITDLDPLKYDLLFERFLNPDRISLPDIDVDFDDAGRERVLDWVSNKYGKTHVAHIITYQTMAAKSAIADVARVQDIPLDIANTIKGHIPDKFPDDLKDSKGKALKVNLKNCYEHVDALKALLHGQDENIRSMLTYARELEDTIRGIGVHACGVIIGADDLTKFAPLATVKDKDTDKDIIITQYDGHVVEDVGLIKMDFLGLKTLTIIKETIKNIIHSKGKEHIPDIDHIPLDDELTYKLFQEGKTMAVFQFESPGMQKHMRNLKPTQIGDLIAMNALYRPGPMDYIDSFIRRKQGIEPITYDIPVMSKYLEETYGITVYQEQVMLLSRLLAGFTRGQADSLRKAMGKKIFTMLADLKPKFIEGGRNNGHDPKVLEKIWKDWEAFASYAFNKSHAACYAWVAYQTAYLKAHFPAEFMAANLTVEKGDIARVTKLMDECKSLHINVLAPDVNESELNFTVNTSGDIRFGLGGVKGVGEGAVDAIVNEREKNGNYKSIFDFVERVNLQACNKKTLESLALSGAFDCFKGLYREQLTAYNSKGEYVLDTLIRYGNTFQNDKLQTQNSLFGDMGSFAIEIQHPELPHAERKSTIVRLNEEKQLVGMFISAHPLDDYQFELTKLCDIQAAELQYFDSFREPETRASFQTPEGRLNPEQWLDRYNNRSVRLGGIITAVEGGISKKTQQPYGRYTIEDYTGSYTFFLFGDNYQQFAPRIAENLYLCISGKIQQRGAGRKYFIPKEMKEAQYEFYITGIDQLNTMQTKFMNTLTLHLPLENVDRSLIDELTEHLETQAAHVKAVREEEAKSKSKETTVFPECKLQIAVYDELGENTVRFSSKKYRVQVTPDFYHWLQLGELDNRFTYTTS